MSRPLRKRYRYAIIATVFIAASLLVGTFALLALRSMGRELGCSMALAYGWGGGTGLFHEYINANPDKKYPPMSAIPGNLFPALESLKPVMDPGNSYSLLCPATTIHVSDPDLEEKFRRPSFAYTGYALANEDQYLAFLESYPAFIESGANFDADLPAPKGRGSFGGDLFLRLSETLLNAQDQIGSSLPVLVEIPDFEGSEMKFRHGGRSGKVLYTHGSFKSFSLDSEFLMTPAIIEKIGEIKARYAKP